MSAAQSGGSRRAGWLAVIVAALGYLVDIYDLILFSVVRKPSLQALGVPQDRLLEVGSHLLDMQMIGMLVGGVLWGMLGDRRGRLSVLFGSILMYSIANIANGFVTDVETYSWLRLIAGIGLAGELGAGVTLVTESLDVRTRGWATTIVAGVGICGAILAVIVAKSTEWRVAYWTGGGLGLALLFLRIGIFESGMFRRTKAAGVSRGNFFALFAKPRRALRYVAIVLCGVPIWYAVGILVTFAPEIGTALGMRAPLAAADAVMACYIGLAAGDFTSGWLSQVLKSRKKAILIFVILDVLAIVFYFTVGRGSPTMFWVACLLLGFTSGYWAVFVTVAAEQFGTNLRATAATTAPNFVRGSVPLLTFGFRALRESLGVAGSAMAVGAITMVIALVSLIVIEETYGKDLDFVEH